MKKVVFIKADEQNKMFTHYFVDSENNKISINFPVMNIYEKERRRRTGLYLVDVSSSGNSFSGYIGVASNIVDINSKNGVEYLRDNFEFYNLIDRCAILRLCKDVYQNLIDDALDLESIFEEAVSHLEKFDLESYVQSSGLKIYKSVNVKIGDCDTFKADAYAYTPSFKLSAYQDDKYLHSLSSFYVSSFSYFDDQSCSGYEMKIYFEKNHENTYRLGLDNEVEGFKIKLKSMYNRRRHFLGVYEQLLAIHRQNISSRFYQQNKDAYDYQKTKFPFHNDPYRRRIDYEF